MRAKDELRIAVEALSEPEAAELLLAVQRMRVMAEWDRLPPDDEEESPAERALAAEARSDVAAGRMRPWSEVKRQLRG